MKIKSHIYCYTYKIMNKLKELKELMLAVDDDIEPEVIEYLSKQSLELNYAITEIYQDDNYWKERLEKIYKISLDDTISSTNIEWSTIYDHISNIKESTLTDFLGAAIELGYTEIKYTTKIIPEPGNPPSLTYPVLGKYSSRFISNNRKFIHETIVTKYFKGNANFESLSIRILKELYKLYDIWFFSYLISKLLSKKNAQLTFCVNSRLTSASGRCGRDGCNYTIEISDTALLQTFKGESKYHMGSGLKCYDRTECLMHTFEHELIHLVMLLLPRGSSKR